MSLDKRREGGLIAALQETGQKMPVAARSRRLRPNPAKQPLHRTELPMRHWLNSDHADLQYSSR